MYKDPAEEEKDDVSHFWLQLNLFLTGSCFQVVHIALVALRTQTTASRRVCPLHAANRAALSRLSVAIDED